MKKLSELFDTCLNIKYEQVGDKVNYAFKEEQDTLYIFFECSNGIEDWRANFDFKKQVYGLFKVHRGFYDCYYQARNIVLDKVYSKEWKQVIVVAYSHGSALATICHQDIKYHFPNLDLKTYAFESPRVFKVSKQYLFYWEGLTRIEDNWDIVCHVPPKLFGFTDVGELIKIKGDTSLVKKKLPKCVKSHYQVVVMNGIEHFEQEKTQ